MKTENNQPKHTPGPWKVKQDIIVSESTSHPLVICKMTNYKPAEKDMQYFNHMSQANAQLIASAPEMLDMLKEVLLDCKNGYINSLSFQRNFIYRIENLLKKATGQ